MRGLYVHIPFCLKKCSYCDFVSYSGAFGLEDDYVNALLSEFASFRGEKVDTVYFGGGTPTSLKTENLTRLLDGVFSSFHVAQDAEVTIECNPKTADFSKFRALLSHGANRLSIGVQTFDEQCLKAIGRVHAADDAKRCIQDAARAGFLNLSADLMFGLPGQSVASAVESVEIAATMPVRHISCYGLMLEEHTPLWEQVQAGTVSLPEEDAEFSMYCNMKDALNSRGFHQYEISNFAKDGFSSRHNLKYWNCEEYIGCGAAAHSYFEGARFCHGSNLLDYIQNPAAREDVTVLDKEEQMSEFLILGLRKTAGVSETEFFARFGVSMNERYNNVIEKFTKAGLLVRDGGVLRFSEQGVYVSNTVLCEFV